MVAEKPEIVKPAIKASYKYHVAKGKSLYISKLKLQSGDECKLKYCAGGQKQLDQLAEAGTLIKK